MLEISPNSKMQAKTFDHFMGFLWGIFMVSSIFYVFDSGLPQPSDWILAIMSIWLWLAGRLTPLTRLPPIMRTLFYFVVYTGLVNISWAAVMQNHRFLLFTLFYAFNFTACLVFWSLYQRLGNRLLVITAYALVISTCTEVAILLTSVLGFRNTGSFNNPNQLAYFAILVTSIGTVLNRSDILPRALSRFGIPALYTAAGYASYASMSRSGLIVYLFAAAIGLVSNLRVVLVLCVGLVVVLFSSDISSVYYDVNKKVAMRFKSGNSGLSHVEEFLIRNGSQRIAGYPQYLILGAGEGDNTRFERFCRLARNGNELHSTPAIMAFSYGIVGIFLSFTLVMQLYRKEKRSIVFIFSALAFSFAHNGLRQAEFWLMFLVIYIVIEKVNFKRKTNKLLPLPSIPNNAPYLR